MSDTEKKTAVEIATENLRLARRTRDAGTTTPEGHIPGPRLTGAAWDAADAAVDRCRAALIAAKKAARS